jgi:phosphotransferase system HPr-like phosphotransfer protein
MKIKSNRKTKLKEGEIIKKKSILKVISIKSNCNKKIRIKFDK